MRVLRLARGKREAAAFAIGCAAVGPMCSLACVRALAYASARLCVPACVCLRACACVCLCGGSFQCAGGRFMLGSSIPAKFFASQFQKVEDWVLVLSQSSSG